MSSITLDSLKLSNFIIFSNKISKRDCVGDYYVIYSSRTGRIFIANEITFETLIANEFLNIPAPFLEQLLNAKIIVHKEEEELLSIIGENLSAIDNHEELYQVIQPTASCQLGCGYCGQQHSKKLLSNSSQQLLVDRLRLKLASNKFSKLSIGWFGAEPLSGLPVMRSMSPLLQNIALEYNCSYVAKIVTNGLSLTNNIAEELESKHKINSVEITLDGVAIYHDKRRFMKSGGATFDKIFQNLCEIALNPKITFAINIRCNIDRQNIEGVIPLIQMIAEKGIQSRVSLYFVSVYSWGNDAHLNAIPSVEFGEREIDWFTEMFRLGYNVGLLPERRKIVCMALQKDAELVDAFGEIFNCSEVPYVPAYGTPNKYALGNLSSENSINTRNRFFEDFNSSIQNKEFQCHQCKLLPVCGGRCPKQWVDGHIPCPPAKFNMKERLKLLFELSQ